MSEERKTVAVNEQDMADREGRLRKVGAAMKELCATHKISHVSFCGEFEGAFFSMLGVDKEGPDGRVEIAHLAVSAVNVGRFWQSAKESYRRIFTVFDR